MRRLSRPRSLRRRWWPILATTVVVLLVAAGVVVSVLPPSSGCDSATSAPRPSGGGTAVVSTDASACGLPGGDQVIPSGPPAGEVTWQLVGYTAVPAAPTLYGPARIGEDGHRACLAHSPTGALFAAGKILGMSSDPALQQAMTQHSAAATPGREAALQQLRLTGPAATNSGMQLRGFAVSSYTEQRASVRLAVGGGTSTTVGVLSLPLLWQEGDWKLEIPGDGTLASLASAAPDLTGFTPWSGA